MQERYLGDVHDYFKFLFLKFLSETLKMKIGLNWFLVDPKDIGQKEIDKNDGERRNFLHDMDMKNYDKLIIEELKSLKNINERDIHRFTKNTHLASYINFFNRKLTTSNRQSWIQDSLIELKDQKIFFLDPDNGFSENKKGKMSLKYLGPEDCKKILSQNKIIIFTQFQSFTVNHKLQILKLKQKLQNYKFKVLKSVIRNRTSPNTFYITISSHAIPHMLENVFEEYTKRFSKVELIK
tara:strand:- start:215 stop:928 length:714 start_codon:yes stop_codon:yes gene_type:complete